MDEIVSQTAGGGPAHLGDLIDRAEPEIARIPITGVTADSRLVRPGFLFVAVKGSRDDGSRFIADAIAAGAAAVVAAEGTEGPEGAVPIVPNQDPRRSLSLAAARFYPKQPRELVAVTGTSGKTSVAVFTRQIFEAAGFPAASLGTIGLVDRGRAVPGGLTTPDPVKLHETLDRLARDGVDHVAIEASSHGIDQRRLDGLRLAAAGFTNLGRDHLDYHPTVEAYLEAKLRLFRDLLGSGSAVVNADSDVADRVVAAVPRGNRVLTVGAQGRDVRTVDVETVGLSQTLVLEVFGVRHVVSLPLAGAFQAENAIVAAGLAIAAEIDPAVVIDAVAGLQGAPGRLERVAETPEGAAIFIDYAHKPEAVHAALAALRPLTRGRLIVVLGAGGDRDPGKRPLMGAAASAAADVVIVTDDNPRSEDPALIRRAILAGAPGALEIAGRGEAIAAAIAMLCAGDVLCVAGKGHETGQIIGGKILPFSDHDAVRGALREIAL